MTQKLKMLKETTCCTIGGMSGSPILVRMLNEEKLIGVHVGGPPLPYQYDLLKVSQEFIEGRNLRVFRKEY